MTPISPFHGLPRFPGVGSLDGPPFETACLFRSRIEYAVPRLQRPALRSHAPLLHQRQPSGVPEQLEIGKASPELLPADYPTPPPLRVFP